MNPKFAFVAVFDIVLSKSLADLTSGNATIGSVARS
jgi:hypothetical protein